jgi:hypothetical protein
MKPLFCSISTDGGTYCVNYHKAENYTGASRSGYDLTTFRDLPAQTPVIDFRTADQTEVMKVILKVDGIAERDSSHFSRPIPLTQYLDLMRGAGATITTLSGLQ